MTKKEIAIIQKKESELWLALVEYDYENAPTDGDYAREIEWYNTDVEYRQHLSAWYHVRQLMETLGVECLYDENHERASNLNHDLFLRRQASQGIYYDEQGNEIKTEEPEEETPEELTEEEAKEDPDKFRDIETGEIVTAGELYREYTANYTEEERREISFVQYENNCMTYNGGTLERI